MSLFPNVKCDNKMKILLIIDWFLYYTIELANALATEHEVMLITRDHSFEISSPDNPVNVDEFLDENLSQNIIREKLKYRQRNPINILEVPRLYKRIKNYRPDVIHVQENNDWRIYFLAKMYGFNRVVLTIHDVIKHPGESSGLRRYQKFMRFKAKKIIVHGNYLKDQLLLHSPEIKAMVYVIPHGAFSIYRNWDEGMIREEEKTILFFGRISRYKGIDTLIKAESVILGEIENVKIIIAGRGEDFEKYESLIRNKNRYEILNRFIPNAEVPGLFRRATVVVLPYTEASQSGVIPIAYVFGKPVVATNVGSLPEVVSEGLTGFIVPPNNPEKLGKAIIKILKDDVLRETMKKNALKMAETKLSWNTISKETVKVYSLGQINAK